MDELLGGEPIGILRGASSRDSSMDIVAPHLHEPPARGDFALVPNKDRALVLRISGAFPSGSFAEASERGADYLAQLSRAGQSRAVPERVRELLLRFRIEVHPLGWLTGTEHGWQFEAGVRSLQLFGHPVYEASDEALRLLVNVGLENEDPQQVVQIGVLARGHEFLTQIPVRFSIRRLKGRRSFVFARAGYGKSNLVKLLLSRLYQAPPDVGLLIVDPEGEYAFPQRSESGGHIPGLVDHPKIRERVTVFTERAPEQFPEAFRRRVAGRIRLDVAELSAHEFLSEFVAKEKMEQVWSNRLRAAKKDGFRALIELLREERYGATDQAIADALGIAVRAKKEGSDVSCQAIRNNVVPVLDQFDKPGADLVGETVKRLIGTSGQPGVVVLDVSAMSHRQADQIVRIVLQRIFQNRVKAFTGGPRNNRGVLLVLEEAQTVLGGRSLDDQDVYVRWVKEGRKYGLGALLITQQPGAISPLLVSQADNFFAMHLLAERDLQVLGAANAHYTPEILEFLRTEPVKGNCYFWSAPDQPYVVATHLDNYDEEQTEADHSEDGHVADAERADDAEAGYDAWLRRAVLKALCGGGRVWLFPVESIDDEEPAEELLAVAAAYLATNIPGAEAWQERRAEDWEDRWDRPALRSGKLDHVLHELGVAASDRRAIGQTGRLHNRPLVLIGRDALLKAAAVAQIAPPTLRRQPIKVRSAAS